MADRQLILHIGFPKTGTTSIQRACLRHHQVLAEHNLEVATLTPKGGVGKTACCNRLFVKGRFVWNRLEKVFAQGDRDLLISAETFSRAKSAEDLARLKKLADKYFSGVKVIAYLRRQDLAAVSHKQQAAKIGRHLNVPPKPRYGRNLESLPDVAPHPFLNYEYKIRLWMDAFGDECVDVRIYDRKRLIQGDSVADFADYLGIPEELKINNQANPALGRVRTFVIYALMSRRVPTSFLATIRDTIPETGGKLRPSVDQARAFYEAHRPANVRLAQRLGRRPGEDLFDDDFSMYPESPTDILEKNELSEALVHVADGLIALSDQILSDEDLTVLRKAQKVFGDENWRGKRLAQMLNRAGRAQVLVGVSKTEKKARRRQRRKEKQERV